MVVGAIRMNTSRAPLAQGSGGSPAGLQPLTEPRP